MASFTLTNNNDNYIVPIGSNNYVDAAGGSGDIFTMDWSSLTAPIRFLGNGYTDDFSSTITYENFEIFKLTGGSDADDLRGGDKADILIGGAGNDTLTSYLGADFVDGGTGKDTWIVDYSTINANTSVALLTAGATYTITASGANIKNIEALQITTGTGKDSINCSAMSGNDYIYTSAGDDTISAGLGFDYVNAGDGIDTLVLDYSSKTTNIVHWGTHYEDSGKRKVSTSIDYYGVEKFNITGGSGKDALYGATDNDKLVGGAGNDSLYGFAGVDTIDGGDGIDLWQADYSQLLANVTVNISTTTQSTNTGAVIANIERLEITTNLGNDVIITNSGIFNDVITTNDGNDSVTTGRGKDVVNAGGGDDLLVMNWSATTQGIMWNTDGYHDNNNYSWWHYTSGSTDKLDYAGFDRFSIIGGTGNDYLHGASGADTLTGGAGNDLLESGSGNDLIDAGTGNDTINSGSGNDTVNGGTGTDYWIADLSGIGLTAVVINTAAGQTVAQATAAGLSILGIEGLNLITAAGDDNINTTGSSLDDSVSTGMGNDLVNLGRGFDTADGGGGVDSLTVNYSTLTSSVRISNYSYYSWDNSWYGTYSDQDGTSSTTFFSFEKFNIFGGSGDDDLIGGGNNDSLSGGGGDDILNGVSGKDTISGGVGDDTWQADYYSTATTALTLNVDATGSGTLAGIGTVVSGIENFKLTTGGYNDVVNLLAIAGNHSIYTGDGNDNVRLGAGVSYADGGSGSDVLTVDMSSSTSSIASKTDYYYWYSLRDTDGLNAIDTYNFDTYNITSGSGDDKIVGWTGNDTLTGGAGKDLLTGNGGNDVLTGGLGNDIFNFSYYGNGVDTVKDATAGDVIRINTVTLTGGVSTGNGVNIGAGQVQLNVNNTTKISTLYIGTDTASGSDVTIRLEGIYSTNSFSLSGSDIILTSGSTSVGSTGNDTLLGSSGNDTLSGGIGDDSLSGDAGDDSILGEVGNDTLDGGQGNDTLDGGDSYDVLIGGLGLDMLQGGLGSDIFQYTDVVESSPGIAYRDVISDFNSAEGDRIDLSSIDANVVLAGDQAFKFVGTSFTGSAGEVIYNDDVVSIDINADGLIDMEIQLIGAPIITSADFIL